MHRISPAEVEIGMHICRFEGSWLNHPFLRSNFEVRTERQLRKIRDSKVDAILVREPPRAAMQLQGSGNAAPSPDAPGKMRVMGSSEDQQRARALLDKSKDTLLSTFADLRMGRMVEADQLVPLVDEISDMIDGSHSVFHNILSLKTRDEYTYLHSVAVCAMMIKFGRRLGLPETDIPNMGLAGLLHDVGKAFVPDDILNKEGKLTDEEFQIMRSHPRLGHDELIKTKGVPKVVLDVCLHHHEKMSGAGYPHALAKEDMTLPMRMGAICDVYDALTSDRCYKEGWSPQHALREMSSWHGHFDPTLLRIFQEVLSIYPVGARLRLASGDVAIVGSESANPAFHSVFIIGNKGANVEGRPVLELVRSTDIVGSA